MSVLEYLKQPWPWYIAGPLIGLIIPALLIIGNKAFGISSNLRHICAACIPANISFFKYDWKKESWNLFFVLGIVAGAFLASTILQNPNPMALNANTANTLSQLGINNYSQMLPIEIFSWENLFTLKGFIFMIVGGFLIGFGTRYAGGCTSGHAIMGISNLQWPSLVATISFFIGGLIMTHFLLPYLLNL